MIRLIGVYDYTVILTYISLLFSLSGMLLASKGHHGMALNCLVCAGLCDGFDGRVARSKKNRTEMEKSFGIQLDSLCDVISFGVFPAFWCYCVGVDGVIGLICLFFYCLCAVIRLAFFNVVEEERQKTEGGSNKYYRGLPVTTASMILPLLGLLRPVLSASNFALLLHFNLAITGFLFILDFSVKKLDLGRLIPTRKH